MNWVRENEGLFYMWVIFAALAFVAPAGLVFYIVLFTLWYNFAQRMNTDDSQLRNR